MNEPFPPVPTDASGYPSIMIAERKKKEGEGHFLKGLFIYKKAHALSDNKSCRAKHD